LNRASKIKKLIFEILYTGNSKREWYFRLDDYFISGLILLNVVAIILESFDSIYYNFREGFIIFELISVIFFTIEYFLRIWVSDLRFNYLPPFKARQKYIFSGMGLIDLFAILPFYIPFFVQLPSQDARALRLLRLFRIFKLTHYSKPFQLIGKVISYKKKELLITIIFTLIIMLLTSSIMFEIEHRAQPDKFENIFGAFWWAVTTLTTIGYGDVVPISDLGKILASITAIFGVGLVAIPTGIISAGFLQVIGEEKKNRQKNRKLTYNYGKRISNNGKKLNLKRLNKRYNGKSRKI
jgi:voltage-gated potassium channel